MSETTPTPEIFSKDSPELFPKLSTSHFQTKTILGITDLTNPVFSYSVRGGATTFFTTDPVYGDNVTQEQFDGDIAAITGFPVETVNTIGRAMFERLLAYARNTQRMPLLYQLFQMKPTSGGSSKTIDGFHNATQIGASILIIPLKATVSTFRQGLSTLLNSSRGMKVPIIHSITMLPNRIVNFYVAGKMNELKTENGALDESDPIQGVFYAPVAGGPTVRAELYGDVTDTIVQSQAPPAAVGPQKVTMVTKPGKHYLTASYGVILQVGVSTSALTITADPAPVVPVKPE